MNKDDRKAAVAAYKERKVVAGVYAVRCAATGAVWVGATPNLGSVQTSLWFQLRMKSCVFRDLQAAWNAQGPDAFAFEIIERLEEEESAYIRNATLRARAAHWRETLNAFAI